MEKFIYLDFLERISSLFRNKPELNRILEKWISILILENINTRDLISKKNLVYSKTLELIDEWVTIEIFLESIVTNYPSSSQYQDISERDLDIFNIIVNNFRRYIEIYWSNIKKIFGYLPTNEDLFILFESGVLGAWLLIMCIKTVEPAMPTGGLDTLLRLEQIKKLRYYTLEEIEGVFK